MTRDTWKTNSDGILLLGAGSTDAAYNKIEYFPGESLCLEFRRTSGGLFGLVLKGLKEVKLGPVWESACLSEIYVWRATQVPNTSFEIIDGGWNALFEGRCSAEQVRHTASIISARSPEPLLVVVDHTFGSQIAAVCDRIELL